MNTPVQLPQPVNPTATIQPVIAALSNNAPGGEANPLSTVTPGTLVEGFVINRDAQNNPIVRTAIGDLKVTSEVFLKTGSEVVFRVDTTQLNLARILTVDGLTPDVYNARNASRAITNDTITTTALQSPLGQVMIGKNEPEALNSPPVLRAIVLQPQASAPTSANSRQHILTPTLALIAAQYAGLRAGTTIKLTLLDLKLPPLPVALSALPTTDKLQALMPENTLPVAHAARTAATNLTQIPSATPGAPNTSLMLDELAPLQQALTQHEQVRSAVITHQANTMLTTELLSAYRKHTPDVAPEHRPAADVIKQPTPATAPTRATSVITAQVIGHDAEGANILHTSFASLKLYTSQPLPTGTTLVVEAHAEQPLHSAQANTSTNESEQTSSADLATPSSTRKPEEALEEAVSWLLTTHPDAARDIRDRLPTPTSKLTSGLLFFIAAMRGGDVTALLGNRAARLLEVGAPSLYARVRQQLATTGDSSTIAAQPWSNFLIPLLHGQELQQVKLYVQREPEKERSRSANAGGQRFVLEINLSQLGPMQLDGFIRNADRGKSFDLMVRTEIPLESSLTQEIRSIFESAIAATRLSGQVVFQTGAQHFFRPAPAAPSQFGGDSLQTILA